MSSDCFASYFHSHVNVRACVHFPRPFVSMNLWLVKRIQIHLLTQIPKPRHMCAHSRVLYVPFIAHLSFNYDADRRFLWILYRFSTSRCFFFFFFFRCHLIRWRYHNTNNHSKLPPQINHVNSRHNWPIHNNA